MNLKTKKNLIAQLALATALVSLALSSRAALYDFSFTGGGSVASGQIDVVNGLADNGYIDVTAGPNQGIYSLLAPNFGQNANGDNFAADNLISLGSAPFLDNNGLQFGGFTQGFALWSDSADTFELFGYNYNGVHQYGAPDVLGTAALVSVPEPATIASLAGVSALAIIGLGTFRRKSIKSA